MQTGFFGYPGQVWGISYVALTYFYNQLNANSLNPTSLTAITVATYNTLINAIVAIETFQAANAAQAETQNLTSVAALSLSLDATTQQYFTNRFVSIEGLSLSLQALQPTLQPLQILNNLENAQPAIPTVDLLSFYMSWNGETPPTGLTSGTFYADCEQAVTTWSNVATAIQLLQGNNLTQEYDTANRQYAGQLAAVNQVNAYLSSAGGVKLTGGLALPNLWTSMVCLPAILNAFNMLALPQTYMNQQCGVIRYILENLSYQVALFLLTLRRYSNSLPQLATVQQNDNLFDIAARTTGNLENWQAIAVANQLEPPWVGPGSSAPMGTQLVIPNNQTSSAPPINYNINVLGADYDLGAPTNPDMLGAMPPWTGDFQIQTGILNFQRALGKRLLTALESFIYHQDFGSRLPPLIGTPLFSEQTGLMAQYAQSALASDPRTGAVLSCTATTAAASGATQIVGTVQPIGVGTTAVQVNQTLLPLS